MQFNPENVRSLLTADKVYGLLQYINIMKAVLLEVLATVPRRLFPDKLSQIPTPLKTDFRISFWSFSV